MFRLFDVFFSLFALIIFSPLFSMLLILEISFRKKFFFRQERLGLKKKTFVLYKLRTMKLNTANLPTHYIDKNNVTRTGRILRRTKLDELPQLWNVLKGDMSLVGPRPNLINQEELIVERDKKLVYDVRPGITGLAQLSDIDMSTPQLLAETDAKMISELTLQRYFTYIIKTALGKGYGDRVDS